MRILLIEDNAIVAQGIKSLLRGEGFDVETTDTGGSGIDLATLNTYDIAVLDLELPDMSGFDVIKALRNTKVGTPIVVLSGNAMTEARIQALGLGADDYLTKPFHKSELVARIRAVIRRSRRHLPHLMTEGRLTINCDEQTAQVEGAKLNLTRLEYKTLEFLFLKRGAESTKAMLFRHLYEDEEGPAPKIIDVFICKLRRKLADAMNGESYIRTVWGHGYELLEPCEKKAA